MAYDLYKGATRPPMMFGVPTDALLVAFVVIGILSTAFSVFMWIILPFAIFIMRMIAKKDDRAFRLWGMWLDTKKRCNSSVKKFWGATTYTTFSLKNKYNSWSNKEMKK